MHKPHILLAAISAALMAAPGPTDLAGKPVQLFEGGKTTVLIFVRTDCPISNRYAPELRRLYDEFSSHATFWLVYADRTQTADMIHKHMAAYGYPFGALRDPEHGLVRLAKARVTPEAAVFSSRGQLLYHGRIDNRVVDFGKTMAQPTQRDLEETLKAVLAGKPVDVSNTPAIGCFLSDIE